MVRAKGHGKVNEILTPAETEALTDQKKELIETLSEMEQFGQGTAAAQIDIGRIKTEIKKIDRAIEERQPPKVSGSKKDELAKEAEEIEQILREGMPTREEMAHPAKNPGAVRKHMRWDFRNKAKIERYRYIQRLINPEDPRSVENLRRDK